MRRNHSTVQVNPVRRFRTRTTSPQGWAERIRRTVGGHVSTGHAAPQVAASRPARTLRIASGPPACRPGFPLMRPWPRAAATLVRSPISAGRQRPAPAARSCLVALWCRSGRANELRVCAARSRRRSSVGGTRVVGRRLAIWGFHQGRWERGLIIAARRARSG